MVRRQVTQELHNGGNGATALGRRRLRRPTTAETADRAAVPSKGSRSRSWTGRLW